MNPLLFSTAFMLGLFGSLHCLGMCGPLAMALPGAGERGVKYLVGRVLYNLGRVLTYGVMGILFGLLGQTMALAGLQRWLSIIAGLLLVAAVFLGRKRALSAKLMAPLAGLLRRLKATLGRLLGRHSLGTMLGIGLLNGLLPCGLVYMALAGAAATGRAVDGGLFMVWFGLGTFPLMLATSLFGHLAFARWRTQLQRAIPLVLLVLGFLFIMRGLSLGIPYISPDLSSPEAARSCCE